jgi:hypothetical protein
MLQKTILPPRVIAFFLPKYSHLILQSHNIDLDPHPLDRQAFNPQNRQNRLVIRTPLPQIPSHGFNDSFVHPHVVRFDAEDLGEAAFDACGFQVGVDIGEGVVDFGAEVFGDAAFVVPTTCTLTLVATKICSCI